MTNIHFKIKAGAALYLIFMAGITGFAQEQDLWNHIKDTSWRYEDAWTGGIVTFFETHAGKKMAVWQLSGSGVMVTGSFLYRVRIESGRLLLLESATAPRQEAEAPQQEAVYIYVYDEASSVLRPRKGLYTLVSLDGGPVVANKFRAIPLEELKREDYSRLDLLP
jgi:hypothetical protein